jgi:ankyrin repeat protein
MTSPLASLPPELVLEIAECELLDQRSLYSLIQASKGLYVLLWPVLYRQAITQNNSVAFIRCIRTGSVTGVSKFIRAGVDVNAKVDMFPDIEDFRGRATPLATAVVRGHKEIVNLLLHQGADVEAKIEGFLCHTILADHRHPYAGALSHTAFSAALALGYNDIAIRLIQEMADLDSVVCTVLGIDYTALEQAIVCRRPEVVRLLLESGAELKRTGAYGTGGGLAHIS